MKNLKKATCAIVFAVAISFTFQCATPKVATTTFEQQTPFKVKPVFFQEWYAGIKVGGTGINIFIPISDVEQDIAFDEVFFRNLRGKLTKKEEEYMSVLKHPSRHYTFQKAEKPNDYPFDLKDNECVISYIENGQTKYYKIIALNEVAGTYYEDGPPSVYAQSTSSGMASLDEEEDDN
ncbi:hypothetical protein [uncultured Winogradskyella sp.]|uniref:hypothetical protein n=1 Tax=uncultured Winogradskyella sp. TaxID=395353 RepID=UPI00261E46B7|nr:hypothetical protein [uncultured Winogradskyella sp.]